MANKLLYARDLVAGMNVDSIFLVRTAERRMTKATARNDSKPFLAVDLADKTGTVSGRVWSENLPFVESILVPNAIVQVHGTTQAYGSDLSLVIADATVVTDADMADFVPSSLRDNAQMRGEYTQLASTVAQTELHRLMQWFVTSDNFGDFCESPAAQTDVYNFRGGLLEHTLGVAQSALAIATTLSDVDTDLLLTAALLHDIGKVDAYNATSFAQTDDGLLLDTTTLSLIRLDRYVDFAGGLPEMTRRRLFHAIASHESRGFGQTLPQTKEAVILQSVNQLDVVLKAASASADENGWTEQVRSLRRRFYRGTANDATDTLPPAAGAVPVDPPFTSWDEPDDFATEIPF